jgi:hypothetical protein
VQNGVHDALTNKGLSTVKSGLIGSRSTSLVAMHERNDSTNATFSSRDVVV